MEQSCDIHFSIRVLKKKKKEKDKIFESHENINMKNHQCAL